MVGLEVGLTVHGPMFDGLMVALEVGLIVATWLTVSMEVGLTGCLMVDGLTVGMEVCLMVVSWLMV